MNAPTTLAESVKTTSPALAIHRTAWDALNKNVFVVKELVEMFKMKTSDSYDLFDPDTNELLLVCREPHLGGWTKFFRFLGPKYKPMTPFDVVVSLPDGGPQVVRIKRPTSLFGTGAVTVLDENNAVIGRFERKFSWAGHTFAVKNKEGQEVCTLKSNWKNWTKKEYLFMMGEIELARVTQKFTGLRDLLTSADNYAIVIDARVPKNSPVRQLILAAVMCIDKVVKRT